jgi:hypothetical protein
MRNYGGTTLNIVGTRQYLDWRELRHHDLHSTDVRQRLERFCRGITSALHKRWVSPEERQRRAEAEEQQKAENEERRKAAEAEAERLAAEERRHRESEAARRAEAAERARLAELEARHRAAEERRRLKAAAEKQAQEERAFTAATQTGSVAAIDAFLAENPESRFVADAQKRKAGLLARAEAYDRAMTRDDPILLKSFRDTHKKGADVERVHARLRLLEPQDTRLRIKPAIVVPGALAVMLVGAIAVWLAARPSVSNQQVAAMATPPPAPILAAPSAQPASSTPPKTKVEPAGSAATSAPPQAAVNAPAPNPAAAPAPDPAEFAWSLLKDTHDAAALQRFTAQYPESPLRQGAEARMAALAAEQAAWNLAKDSKDPDQLRIFVQQFPSSTVRADAEQRIASLSAATPTNPVVGAPNSHDLARSLQLELIRVGCFAGKMSGEFDDDTKAAWHKFIKLTSKSMPDDLSPDAINAVRGINKRVCPVVCPHGKHAEGDTCVANEPPPPPPPPKHTVKREVPDREPNRPEAPVAAPRNNGYCQGRQSGVAVSNGSNNCQ